MASLYSVAAPQAPQAAGPRPHAIVGKRGRRRQWPSLPIGDCRAPLEPPPPPAATFFLIGWLVRGYERRGAGGFNCMRTV